MSRSWFYLTLWRGTPEEFTTELTLQIQKSVSTSAYIKNSDLAQVNVDTTTSTSVDIENRNVVGVDVTRITEVMWYVG